MARPLPAGYNPRPLSRSELLSYAGMGGIWGADLNTAVAIALAESTGRPQAIGDQGSSYGLWQIHEPAHPELFALYPDWWNPVSNARMAASVHSKAGGWGDWTTYNNGDYKKFLTGNGIYEDVGAAAGDAIAAANPVAGVVDAVKTTGGLVWKAGAWMSDPASWVRVAQVILGGGLVLAALSVVARPVAEKAAGGVVGSVTGVGKVAKVATAATKGVK